MHNGISRLYENLAAYGGRPTTGKTHPHARRILPHLVPPDPPWPIVNWSQRDNNNYEESALLSTITYFSSTPSTSLRTTT